MMTVSIQIMETTQDIGHNYGKILHVHFVAFFPHILLKKPCGAQKTAAPERRGRTAPKTKLNTVLGD